MESFLNLERFTHEVLLRLHLIKFKQGGKHVKEGKNIVPTGSPLFRKGDVVGTKDGKKEREGNVKNPRQGKLRVRQKINYYQQF